MFIHPYFNRLIEGSALIDALCLSLNQIFSAIPYIISVKIDENRQ